MKLITSAILRKSSFFLMGGLTVAAGWGVFAVGDVFDKMKEPQLGNNPVAISATSPVQRKEGAKTLPFSTTSHVRRSSARMASQPSTAGDLTTAMPSASMGSVNPFQHSGAIAMSGASRHSAARSSSSRGEVHSTAEDAKRAASISRGGNMLALSSSTMITAPGASNAASIATMAVNASISSGPRRSPTDPKDPYLDEEEEDDVPVGPIPFAFMALLAGGYMFLRQRRREEIKVNR